ncbi:MAG: VOC family protein [Chloroflexi bacterium]|nr:VOC family protein [Chloroflexota bacterium]
MLTNYPVRLSIPVADFARAKQFYAEKLGQFPFAEDMYGLSYKSGETYYTLVRSDSAGQATYSLMTWLVTDIETVFQALSDAGIIFEEYDLPFLKTVDGIATLSGDRVAWFKDSEGNLLAIAQLGTN